MTEKPKKTKREKALRNAARELGVATELADTDRMRAHVEMARTWIALAAAHAPQADGSYDR